MSDNKEKKESAYSQLKGFHRAIPIILSALALFIAVCFITKNTGTLGRAISGFLRGARDVRRHVRDVHASCKLLEAP